MPKRFRLILAILIAPVLLAGGVLLLALDSTPAVPERSEVALADVQHALAVARSHDPRRAEPGRLMQASVTERDVELLLNHAAHRMLGVRVKLQLEPGVAELTASTPWAQAGWLQMSGWLNLHARWRETEGLPELQSWRIGLLPLPNALAPPLLRAAAARMTAAPDLALVPEVLKRVRFGHDTLALSYVWQGDTSQRVLAVLTPPAEQERLRAYADLLVALTTQRRSGPQPPLALPRLIGPMFELARQRSLHNDAALENRAAVLTLAMYVTGRDLGSVVPGGRSWPQPQRLQVLLNGRDDFPQHFLVSAMLAMEGTSPFTNAVGLTKEVEDAHGGSGFSFNDMAANRAGMRFGRFALQQPARLQELLARGVDERSLMPDVADLPEFLSQAEFQRRYQRIGSPGYQRLLADIEDRVERLALYR
jgi:hypothetical protein